MAKARRAKARPARVVVPILLALLVGGLAVSLTQGWFSRGTSTTSTVPSVLATAQTTSQSVPATGPATSGQPTTPGATSATPGSGQPTANTQGGSGSAQGSATAARALQQCRAKVQARDQALQAAATGVGHWSEHVDAQTDADNGDISAKKMQAIFKRTRLAGPSDVKRYRAALARQQEPSSCRAPRGASSGITKTMADCSARAAAQGPVLKAAEDAMGDWQSHLTDMRMSKMGHVDNAQAVWIKSWRAAPPHIKAHRRAAASFDAPAC